MLWHSKPAKTKYLKIYLSLSPVRLRFLPAVSREVPIVTICMKIFTFIFLLYIRSWGKYFKRMSYEDCILLVISLGVFFNDIYVSLKVNLANNHLKHLVIRIPYNVQYVLLKFGLLVPFSVLLLCSWLLGVQRSLQFHVYCGHKADWWLPSPPRLSAGERAEGGSTAAEGCTKRPAPGCVRRCDCNTSLDQNREPERLLLSLLTACPTTRAEGSDGDRYQPLQSPLEVQTCCRCREHTCAGLQHKQTSRGKNGIAHCQEGDGGGWRAEGQSRTGKQLAASFLFFFFFFSKWKTFYASSSNVRGAAEVLKGQSRA